VFEADAEHRRRRREGDDRVAGVDERVQRDRERPGRPGGDEHLVERVDGQPAGREVMGDGRPQVRQPAGRRVAAGRPGPGHRRRQFEPGGEPGEIDHVMR
jgi:hypothetical protein